MSTHTAALDQRVADLETSVATKNSALEQAKDALRQAQLAIARGDDGAEAEADRLAGEVRSLRENLQDLLASLEAARQALRDANAEHANAEQQKTLKRSEAVAREVATAASMVDDAIEALQVAVNELEVAHAKFMQQAPRDILPEAVRDYRDHFPAVQSTIRLWLSFHRLTRDAFVLDFTQPPSTIEATVRQAFGPLLPTRGRPRKGDDPTVAVLPAPAPKPGDSGAAEAAE